MDPMILAVDAFIRRHRLLAPGDRVLVAVSGGGDSVALLRILHALAPSRGWWLAVAHLDHGVRGAASEADARFVKELAGALGLLCVVERLTPGPGRVSESWLREERYRVLRRRAEELRCSRIAVGHTADDQVETVLLHWVQGLGLRGLAGMLPDRGDGVVRPLLEQERVALRSFLERLGQAWREDASNRDLEYARNRLRRLVVPELRRLNPALVRTVGRTAALFRAQLSELDRRVAGLLEQAMGTDDGAVVLRRKAVMELGSMELRQLLFRLACRVAGGHARLAQGHYEALERLVRRGGSASLALPGGIRFAQGHGWLWLGSELEAEPPPEGLVERLPFELSVPRLSGRLVLAMEESERPLLPASANRVVIGARLSGRVLGGPLRVGFRGAVPGGRIRRRGGSRSLKRAFIDARVPWFLRDHAPCLLHPRGIAWGWGVGPAVWAEAKGEEGRHLEVRWEGRIDWFPAD
jgi:tRNA(Ile)-lysidine synthase